MKKILSFLVVLALMSCSFFVGHLNGRYSVLNARDVSYTTVVTATPRATATPRPTYQPLSKGDKGNEVARLQRTLNTKGFSVGTADGRFGPKTEAAVKKFQRMAGLDATGIADDETLALLYSPQAPRITAKPTNTPGPTKTPKPEKMVYITRYGECYHRIDDCGTSTYVTEVTLSDALDRGMRQCSRCY